MSVTRERIQGETAVAVMCIARDELSYPANLREIPLPPERLWVRGRVETDDSLAIAIVGAREATPYGLGCAERLAADLAARGVTVVSGLARGIDSAAHRGALGREVMAVPGPLTSLMSRGAHRLIQDGAALVQGWEDVIAQLPLRFRDQVKPPAVAHAAGGPNHLAHGQHAEKHVEDNEDESSRLLRVIGREPIGIDQIIERSEMAPGRTSALLMTLEIDGRIRQLEGKR